MRSFAELVLGVTGSGSVNFGFASLSPGPWGLVSGPHGPLPVLKSAGDVLTAMGVTLFRSGGSVSQVCVHVVWRCLTRAVFVV